MFLKYLPRSITVLLVIIRGGGAPDDMINIQDQDADLLTKIRKCAAEMLDVANMLSASGGESIGTLGETIWTMKTAAVQLYGYFPAPVIAPTVPSFQLQLPSSNPQKHTLSESSIDLLERMQGPL